MNPEKVKALAENVNNLLQLHHKQAQTTAKLFEICLEFLDENRWPKSQVGWNDGEGYKREVLKRKERKQQLIAAIKGYIKMVEGRDKEV